MIPKFRLPLLLAAATLTTAAYAADSSWATDANGLWSGTANWAGGTIADGNNFTATFGNDITADRTVTLDTVRTIGNLTFTDAAPGTAGSWTVTNGGTAGNILTLGVATGTPVINVAGLGTGKTATLDLVINSTQGLTKTGAGTLVLTQTNTITGSPVVVAQGTLQLGNGGGTGSAGAAITINSGATVEYRRSGNLNLGTAFTGAGNLLFTGTNDGISNGLSQHGLAFDNSAFSGVLTVASARMLLDASTDAGTAKLVTATNGQFYVTAAIANNLEIAGNGTGELISSVAYQLGAIRLGAGTINGTVTMTGDARITAYASTGTINGVLGETGGARNVTFGAASGGAGVVTLTGANTYTGTTSIVSGTLQLGGAGTLGSGNYAATIANAGTLAFASSAAQTLSGVISGAGNLTKAGTGTLTLAANNTYTGGTTVGGGILKLDYGVASGSKLADAAALTFAGGTLEIAGGAGETVGSAVVTGGNSTVTRSSGTGVLQLGALTRTGGAIDFATAGIATTTSVNDASGILGGWATVGGSSFATVSGGSIVAYTGYTDINRQGGLIASSPTTNVRIIEGGTTGNITAAVAGTTGINTLTAQSTSPAVVDLTGNTLRLGVAGAIFNTSGAGTLTFNAGTITAGGADNVAGDILFNNASVTNALTVNSAVADNGTGVVSLSKGGAGTLELGGVNTFTGAINIGTGTLRIGTAGLLGSGSYSGAITNNGVLDYSGVGAQLFGGVISGTGSLVVNGAGSLTLNATSTYTGGTVVNGTSTLTLAGPGGATGIIRGAVTVNTGATLVLGVGNAFGYTPGAKVDTLTINGGAVTNTVAGTDNGWGLDIVMTGGTYSGTGRLSLGRPSAADPTSVTINASATGSVMSIADIRLRTDGAQTTVAFNVADGAAATDLLLSGVITQQGGAVGITKTGAGLMTLSGANAFLGDTFVQDGTLLLTGGDNRLQAGNPVTLGSGTTGGKLVLDGISQNIGGLNTSGTGANAVLGNSATLSTLTVNNAAASVFSGSLGGAGANQNNLALVKSGAGALTLSGVNTYTGATTVNAGALTLDYGVNNTSKLSDTAALTLAGGSVVLSGGSHVELVGSTIVNGIVTITRTSGTAVLALGAITRTSGTIDFGASGIATTTNANVNGILGLWATVNGGADLAMNDGSGNIIAFTSYTDVPFGGVIPNNPSAYVRLNGGTTGNITLAQPVTSIGTLLQNQTTATVIDTTGGTLRLAAAGGISIGSGRGALSIGTAPGAGTLTAGGADNTAGQITVFTSGNALTVNSTLADNGTGVVSINKTGSDRLVLAAANTFTGGVSLTGGTVAVGNDAALGTGVLSASGNGTLAYSGSGTRTLGNAVSLLSGNTLNVDTTAGNLTLAGVLSGSGTFNKLGTGSVILTGANTNTGTVSVTAGTVQVGNAGTSGSLGTGAVTVAAGTFVDFNRSDAVTVANGFSGAGTVRQTGTGTMTITATTMAQNLTVNSGTLVAQGGGFSGDFMTGAGIVTINAGATVIVNAAHAFRGDNVQMTESFVINGGSLILNNEQYFNAVTFNGATVSGAGEMRASNASAWAVTGTTASTIANNVSLVGAGNFNVADVTSNANADLTIFGAVTNTGAFNKTGAGTLVLNGANTYTGATTVTAGTLRFSSSAGIAATAVTVASGASLLIDSTGKTLASLNLAGGSTLGIGALTGATTTVTGALTLGAGAVTVTPTITGSVAPGVINLITAGSIVANGTITATPIANSRITGSIAVSGNTLQYTVLTGNAALVWNNGTTGTWDLNTTSNFLNGAVADKFFNYDTVAFTDASGVGTKTVNVSGTLITTAITVTNSAGSDFVFSGSGTISGTAGLTKAGTGNLTINAAANYTGKTLISAGNLTVGATGSLIGTSGIEISNGTIFTNAGNIAITGNTASDNAGSTVSLAVRNGATFNQTGGTVSLASFGASSTTNISGGTMLVSGNFFVGEQSNGPGTINQSGGTLTLTGGGSSIRLGHWNNANSGVYNLTGGTLDASAATAGAFNIGWDGRGVLTVGGGSGAALFKARQIRLDQGGANTYADSLAILANGTVEIGAGGIDAASTTDVVTLGGGTVRGVANATWASGFVATAASTVDTAAGTVVTLSGALAGAGAITKTGTGTLSLSGANTHTGGVTVANGTLQISANNSLAANDGVTLGAGATGGRLALAGINQTLASLSTSGTGNNAVVGASATLSTLTINNTAAATFAGTLGGSGTNENNLALVKTGTGVLTLTGNNTATGGTTVNGGGLTLDYSANNTSKLADTGVLTLYGATVTLAGGSHTEVIGSTVLAGGTSAIVQTGGTSKLALGAITRSGGSIDFSAANIATTTTANDASGILGAWATINGGADLAMNDGSGNIIAYTGYTDVPFGGAIPNSGANIRLAGGTTGNVTLASGLTSINTLTQGQTTATVIDNASGTLRLGLVGGVTIGAGKGALTIGTAANSGTLTAGGIDNTAGELVVTTSGNSLTINSVVADNGTGVVSLTKAGNDRLILNGTNTYTGGTNIVAGTLELGSAGALGTTGTIAMNGGTLRYGAANATDYSARFSGAAGQQFNVDTNGRSVTFATGLASVGGSLTKNGLGDLALSATSTYSGGTVVNQGSLTLSGIGVSAGSIGTGSLTIGSGATVTTTGAFAIDGQSDATNARLVTINGGALTLAGSEYLNKVVLSGGAVNGPTGSEFLRAATSGLTINSLASATTSTVSGQIDLTFGNLSLDVADGAAATDLLVSGAISDNLGGGTGAKSVTKSGAGLLTLSGTNTYTGPTTITGGTLSVGDGGTTGSLGTGVVSNAGVLILNRSDDYTFANQISGTGSLVKEGAGTLILGADANNFTGDITVNHGTLASGLNQNGTFGAQVATRTFTVNSGARMEFRTNNVLGGGGKTPATVSTVVLNGGTLYTDNFNIIGNLTLNNGATLTQSIADSGGYEGFQFIGGTVNVTGTSASTMSGTGNGRMHLGGGVATTFNVGNVTGNANSDLIVSVGLTDGSPDYGGAGALTKTGSGTLTLTGTNDYTGATTVNGGVLEIGATGSLASSPVVVNAGGTLLIGTTGKTLASLTLNGGALLDIAAVAGQTTTVTGAVTIGAGAILVNPRFTGTVNVNDSFTLLTAGSIVTTGTIQAVNDPNSHLSGTITVDGNLLKYTITSTFADLVWNNAASSGTWTLNGDLNFRNTVTNANDKFLLSDAVTFNDTSGPGTKTITIGGQVNPSLLTVNNSAGNDFVFTGSGDITGSGSLVKTGTGTLRIDTSNTYLGKTTISGGVLSASILADGGAASSIGASSNAASNLVIGGGALEYSGATATSTDRLFTIGDGSGATTATILANGAGTLTFSNAGALEFDTQGAARTLALGGSNTGDNTFNPTLGDNAAGVVSLQKDGAGKWILLGNNTYSGTTTINAGTLQVGNGGTTGSLGSGAVANAGALIFTRSDATAVTGDISGAGSITQSGTGTLTLSGNNSFTGTTTLAAGTLSLGSATALGTSGTVSFTGGTLQFGASNNADYSARFDTAAGQQYKLDTNGATVTLASALTSSGGTLEKSGTGTLVLAGNNTYDGGTTIAAGTLQVAQGGSLGSGNVANNGVLDFATTGSATVNNLISGSGSLTHSGSGTTIVTADNTYTGGTTIASGTLQVGDGGTTGSLGAGDVVNTGVLVFDRTDDVTVVAHVSGTGSLTQSGTGTLTLQNADYSGTTTINSGAVVFSGTSAPTGSVIVGSGANLDFNSASGVTTTIGASVSGAGNVSFSGAGTSVFTGGSALTGDATVNAGHTLDLGTNPANVFAMHSLTVLQNATLRGQGTLSGSLINRGILAPGNSPGTIIVAGDFTNAAGATLNMEIGGTIPGTQYDQIIYGGTAHLAGTLNITFINGFVPAGATTFNLLVDSDSSTVAIDGNFDTVILPPGSFGAVQLTATGVNYVVFSAATAFQNVKIPAGAESFKDALLSLGNADPAVSAIIAKIAAGDSQGASQALVNASPLLLGSLTSLPIDEGRGSAEVIRNRLDAMRLSPPDFFAGEALQAYAVGTGVAMLNGDSMDDTTFDQNYIGGKVGLERYVPGDNAAGFNFGYDRGTGDGHFGGGKVNQDHGSLSGYIGFDVAKDYFLYVGAYAGYSSYDSKRETVLGQVKGDTTGWDAGFSVTAGRTWSTFEGVNFTPYAGVTYTHSEVSGFTESGNSLALKVEDYSQDSIRLRVGADLDKEFGEDPAAGFRIGFGAALEQEVGDKSVLIPARFANGSATPFVSESLTIPETTLSFGPYVMIGVGEGQSVRIGYRYETGFNDTSSHRIDASYTARF